MVACYKLCIGVVDKKSCALCSLVKSGYASHLGPECLKPSTPPSHGKWLLQPPLDILHEISMHPSRASHILSCTWQGLADSIWADSALGSLGNPLDVTVQSSLISETTWPPVDQIMPRYTLFAVHRSGYGG